MTPEAATAVRAEIASIESELAQTPTSGPGAGTDGSTPVLLPLARLHRRLPLLRDALDAATLVREPGVVATGRQVTIATADGAREQFSIVLPGDGDPARGWIAIDSPLGAALARRRAGERALVDAPGGGWVADVLEVR
jgi:transcription elongation factor GreA